ncbi:MAG: hypothetical protein WDO14_16470 [Bacteroidota bacterium]
MTTFFAALTALFVLSTTNPGYTDFKLPKNWDKDFTINSSFHGSMSGGVTDIRFTYDSCIYTVESNREKTKKKIYLMTDKDRVAILEKLRSLDVDKIDPKSEVMVVNDGWSQSICFGIHCIEGGTSVELSEKDKSSFLTAYAYLEQFAIDKTKKVRN